MTEDELPTVEEEVAAVRAEFKKIHNARENLRQLLEGRRGLVQRIGDAREREKKPADKSLICEYIQKEDLPEEIAAGLISSRLIYMYCLPRWKRKNRSDAGGVRPPWWWNMGQGFDIS